jgi:hypothetical protein
MQDDTCSTRLTLSSDIWRSVYTFLGTPSLQALSRQPLQVKFSGCHTISTSLLVQALAGYQIFARPPMLRRQHDPSQGHFLDPRHFFEGLSVGIART